MRQFTHSSLFELQVLILSDFNKVGIESFPSRPQPYK